MKIVKKIIYLLWRLSREVLFRTKFRALSSSAAGETPGSDTLQNHRAIWRRLTRFPSTRYCRLYSSISGIASPLYVPENIYYIAIEPVLNNKAFTGAYCDKNFYERYLPSFKGVFPYTILRGINGVITDKDYRPIALEETVSHVSAGSSYILKPAVGSSGGKDILLLHYDGREFTSGSESFSPGRFIKLLGERYENSFLLQQKISQHPWFAAFNSSSLNTVRVVTYREMNSNTIVPLQAVLRFGREGSVVDNLASGGLACGVSGYGQPGNFAVDKWGNRYDDNSTLKKVGGEAVPCFEKMQDLANAIAASYPYHRLLAFDMTLDSAGKVRLLEVNGKNIEINFIQMTNGPLFREFTEEVIEYCRYGRRSVVFDYTI